MTLKHQTYNYLTKVEDRRPALNSGYVAIAGEVVNQRFVLQLNLVLNGLESIFIRNCTFMQTVKSNIKP